MFNISSVFFTVDFWTNKSYMIKLCKYFNQWKLILANRGKETQTKTINPETGSWRVEAKNPFLKKAILSPGRHTVTRHCWGRRDLDLLLWIYDSNTVSDFTGPDPDTEIRKHKSCFFFGEELTTKFGQQQHFGMAFRGEIWFRRN